MDGKTIVEPWGEAVMASGVILTVTQAGRYLGRHAFFWKIKRLPIRIGVDQCILPKWALI